MKFIFAKRIEHLKTILAQKQTLESDHSVVDWAQRSLTVESLGKITWKKL